VDIIKKKVDATAMRNKILDIINGRDATLHAWMQENNLFWSLHWGVYESDDRAMGNFWIEIEMDKNIPDFREKGFKVKHLFEGLLTNGWIDSDDMLWTYLNQRDDNWQEKEDIIKAFLDNTRRHSCTTHSLFFEVEKRFSILVEWQDARRTRSCYEALINGLKSLNRFIQKSIYYLEGIVDSYTFKIINEDHEKDKE
jgi:hypothetical protein